MAEQQSECRIKRRCPPAEYRGIEGHGHQHAQMPLEVAAGHVVGRWEGSPVSVGSWHVAAFVGTRAHIEKRA